MAGNANSGRRPKPTALKLLHGSRKVNREEPQPTAGVPSCPSFLTAEAKREWGRITAELAGLGLVTLADRAALATYCQSWARFREAEQAISKHGQTFDDCTLDREGNVVLLGVKPRPEVAISQRERQVMKSYLIEFGLSPSSRSRLKAPEKPKRDEFAEMFG